MASKPIMTSNAGNVNGYDARAEAEPKPVDDDTALRVPDEVSTPE
jgi:hypothetical protein